MATKNTKVNFLFKPRTYLSNILNSTVKHKPHINLKKIKTKSILNAQ